MKFIVFVLAIMQAIAISCQNKNKYQNTDTFSYLIDNSDSSNFGYIHFENDVDLGPNIIAFFNEYFVVADQSFQNIKIVDSNDGRISNIIEMDDSENSMRGSDFLDLVTIQNQLFLLYSTGIISYSDDFMTKKLIEFQDNFSASCFCGVSDNGPIVLGNRYENNGREFKTQYVLIENEISVNIDKYHSDCFQGVLLDKGIILQESPIVSNIVIDSLLINLDFEYKLNQEFNHSRSLDRNDNKLVFLRQKKQNLQYII